MKPCENDILRFYFVDRLNTIARRGQQYGAVDNSKCIGQPTFDTHPHLLMDNQGMI